MAFSTPDVRVKSCPFGLLAKRLYAYLLLAQREPAHQPRDQYHEWAGIGQLDTRHWAGGTHIPFPFEGW